MASLKVSAGDDIFNIHAYIPSWPAFDGILTFLIALLTSTVEIFSELKIEAGAWVSASFDVKADVSNTIKSVKISSSTGHNGICARMLKISSLVLSSKLANLFNKLLS